ncbi:MAG: hypothetical protein LBU34_00960 [Planctomycetaceae bacterium]|nr:hypothetical protein [Planctomycetaceae bacterium]
MKIRLAETITTRYVWTNSAEILLGISKNHLFKTHKIKKQGILAIV